MTPVLDVLLLGGGGADAGGGHPGHPPQHILHLLLHQAEDTQDLPQVREIDDRCL